jgi:hypothetical protein
MLVKEVEGSEGKKCEVLRLNRVDPKFSKGLGWVNKIAAAEATKYNASPLVALKRDVERLVQEYKTKNGPSLSEVTFKGFDHNGEYSVAEHTDEDRAKKEEAEKILHDWWMQRMNPKMGWTEMFKEDGARLDHGMSCYHTYDHESRRGKAMAHCYVNATPAQVAGLYADSRTESAGSEEVFESSYTTRTALIQIPIPIPTVSDRESLYRSVNVRNEQDRSFMNVCYSVKDDRRPEEGGKVRRERASGVQRRERARRRRVLLRRMRASEGVGGATSEASAKEVLSSGGCGLLSERARKAASSAAKADSLSECEGGALLLWKRAAEQASEASSKSSKKGFFCGESTCAQSHGVLGRTCARSHVCSVSPVLGRAAVVATEFFRRCR